MLASGAVGPRFEPWSDQTKDYTIGICCLFAQHAALKRLSKDWLARNQDNVSEWGDISVVSVSQHYNNPNKSKAELIIISLKLTCSRHDIAEKLLSWH